MDTRRVDLVLLRALIRGEAWKAQLVSGAYPTVERLAEVEKVSAQYARALIKLAFLSPTLKRAILDGKAPPDVTLQSFMEKGVPLAWVDQARQAGVQR